MSQPRGLTVRWVAGELLPADATLDREQAFACETCGATLTIRTGARASR